jgi:hypothetical protein
MRNFFLLAFIVFSFCVVGFGQCYEVDLSAQIDCENRQDILKEERLNADSFKPGRLLIPNLIEKLPKDEDSWIVSVIEEGGWAGPAVLTKATVRSDGNFLCRKDTDFVSTQIQSEKFEPFSKLIDNTVFAFLQPDYNLVEKSKPKAVPVNHGQISIARTALIIVKRGTLFDKKNKKISALGEYSFRMADFTDENSAIRKIYNLTIAAGSCGTTN